MSVAEVINIVKEDTGRFDVTKESKFTDLGQDSLEYLEMIVHVEQRFGITFTDKEAQDLETVLDLAKGVHDKCASHSK
ncbi:MAG: acyl carrier protein [Candidatus Micrarchaeaceae archaeon]